MPANNGLATPGAATSTGRARPLAKSRRPASAVRAGTISNATDLTADTTRDVEAQSVVARNKAAARQGGLRHVADNTPGITREANGDGFRYRSASGTLIRDAATLARIKALAIPPAWREVWICARADGHIQATGRDLKGRKQYRYHATWRDVRDEAKYERMRHFARALPSIRHQVSVALARPGLSREKILATVVHLLQETMIRIGNEEYARANRSFGLTTLRTRHVKVDGAEVQFQFRGKSGVDHAITLRDRRMAGIIRRMRELPGQELFQYVDADGARHAVGSADVNDFLREISGNDYTAKDFRTWSGTLHAALELHRLPTFASETEARRNVSAAITAVAKRLGNTPAICRKCYVHPLIVDTYLAGDPLLMAAVADASVGGDRQHADSNRPELGDGDHPPQSGELTVAEAAVLALLEKQASRTAA